MFDHSSGHAKQRPDGLNVAKMNKGFGGKHTSMQSTLIAEEAGYLGPFPRKLSVGDTLHLMFQPSDVGPFWMTEAAREGCRHDVIRDEPPKQLPRNRAELIVDLQAKNINTKGKNKKELMTLCSQHEIPITEEVTKINEGWEGKAKGLLQVLWERGFIDGNNLKKYSLTGKKDEFGIVDSNTSLSNLISLCPDFMNKEGMMEHIGAKLRVEVILTSKCHAEIAGEGVEYMWACSKGHYRAMALKDKKGKDKFMASVKKCLSDEVLPTPRLRKFSRRARQYMIAYHAFDSGQLAPELQEQCSKQGPVVVEKLVGKFKTHRCALDFDYKFVMMEDD